MNFLKKLLAASLLAMSATAQAEFSATVLLATDYVFRGISNTDGDPAIQGSMDYEHDSGFYAGIWGSNVKFRENAASDTTVDEATIEIDYYAGFAAEFDVGISWDLGVLYYTYPGAESDLDYDYWEVLGALGYALEETTLEPEAGIELYYSPDYFGGSGDATYAAALLNLSLPMELGAVFSVGKQWFKDDSDLNYTDWKIGLTRSLQGFDIELAYTDTNLSKSDCDDDDICDNRIVFSVSRTF